MDTKTMDVSAVYSTVGCVACSAIHVHVYSVIILLVSCLNVNSLFIMVNRKNVVIGWRLCSCG